MTASEPRSQAVVTQDLPEDDQPLFRPEAIAEQQTQWLGTVLLTPRILHGLFALFAGVAAAAILGLLFFADYTRKERINGWLVPQQGLIRIFAPQPSVIIEIHVEDGAEVLKGEPLLALSSELQSEALGATQEEVVRRLRSRRTSMLVERGLKDELHKKEMKLLADRLDALRIEQEHRAEELKVQRQRVELADRALERLQPLHEQGLMVEQRWQQLEDGRLDHLLRQRTLARDRAEAERERLILAGELEALPFKHRTQLAEIDRNIDALEQELAEAEARRRIVIPAPQAGTVAAMQAEPGGSARPGVPLLSIIPAGSELEAELFIPSRARGFIRPGQQVLLRYQAFPYQKFGHYEGTITSIARSAITPSEFARQISRITSLQGGEEPVYPVTVNLASQTATAYGEQIPLQPGMQLEADVQIESRRLIEWVLDPLFTLTGAWQG